MLKLQSMRTRTKRSIKTNIRTPMQQLDHVSENWLVASFHIDRIKDAPTLIVLYDPADSLDTIL